MLRNSLINVLKNANLCALLAILDQILIFSGTLGHPFFDLLVVLKILLSSNF